VLDGQDKGAGGEGEEVSKGGRIKALSKEFYEQIPHKIKRDIDSRKEISGKQQLCQVRYCQQIFDIYIYGNSSSLTSDITRTQLVKDYTPCTEPRLCWTVPICQNGICICNNYKIIFVYF